MFFSLLILALGFSSSLAGMELYAHRGAAVMEPENTLPAIEEAFRRGYDGVEFDIQMTLDGRIFLLHDETLERTARSVDAGMASTPVGALSYAEVKGIDVGQWGARAYAPLLEEVLKVLPRGKEFLIEIKGNDRAIIEPLVSLLQRLRPDPESIKIISFDIEILREIKALLPQYPVIYNTRLCFTNTVDKMRQELEKVTVIDGINFEAADNVTKEVVDALHAEGKVALVWEPGHRELDSIRVARRLEGCGVDCYITNLLETL